MKTIGFYMEKGGQGKTTLAITAAAALAMHGRRVVLIDADAQASATTALGLDEAPGLYDLLVRDADFRDVLDSFPASVLGSGVRGEAFVVPSNVEARNIASNLTEVTDVMDKLEQLDGWADYVVIDTPPTPSLFHSALYCATDFTVYPVVCDALSVAGLHKSMSRMKGIGAVRAMSGKQPVKTLGIVPNMYRNTDLHRYNLEQIRAQYGDLVTPEIPQRIAWSEAFQMGQSIFAYAPRNGAYEDARRFADWMIATLEASGEG